MPSPFPGMNPYLERDICWHDFHDRFLAVGAGVIGMQIQPDFLVRDDRPDCVYSVLVSRPDDRPEAGFWPLGLADRLPVIPIPLRPPHPDASLDLQTLLDRVYDEAGYEFDIHDGPPQPPLDADEAAWAAKFLPKRP